MSLLFTRRFTRVSAAHEAAAAPPSRLFALSEPWHVCRTADTGGSTRTVRASAQHRQIIFLSGQNERKGQIYFMDSPVCFPSHNSSQWTSIKLIFKSSLHLFTSVATNLLVNECMKAKNKTLALSGCIPAAILKPATDLITEQPTGKLLVSVSTGEASDSHLLYYMQHFFS